MIRFALVGLIQGLTEFLPISSSAHIVLGSRLVGLTSPGLVFEAFLHLGTLAAVLIVFRSDVGALARSFGPRGNLASRKDVGLLMLGTVPVLLAGLALRGVAERLFDSLWVVGGGLLVTSLALVAANRLSREGRRDLNTVGALSVGLAQAAAIVPGVSRSGVTISAGVAMGLSPTRAARFSFLLSLPAVAGAAAVTSWDALQAGGAGSIDVAGIAVGVAVAFLVGWASLRGLLSLLTRGRLWPFAAYCGVLGIFTLTAAGLS